MFLFFNGILLYDYCVLPLRVHGCASQLLIREAGCKIPVKFPGDRPISPKPGGRTRSQPPTSP